MCYPTPEPAADPAGWESLSFLAVYSCYAKCTCWETRYTLLLQLWTWHQDLSGTIQWDSAWIWKALPTGQTVMPVFTSWTAFLFGVFLILWARKGIVLHDSELLIFMDVIFTCFSHVAQSVRLRWGKEWGNGMRLWGWRRTRRGSTWRIEDWEEASVEETGCSR